MAQNQLRMPHNLLAAMALLFNPGLLGCTSSINLGPQNVSHYQCQHLPSVCQTSHRNIQQFTLTLISTYLETSCLDLHHRMQILTYMTRQSMVTSLPNSFKSTFRATLQTTPYLLQDTTTHFSSRNRSKPTSTCEDSYASAKDL